MCSTYTILVILYFSLLRKEIFIDEDIQAQAQIPIEEPLQGLGGSMTRARAKKLEESLQQVVATIFEAAANKKDLEATIQNALLFEAQ